MQFSKKFLVGSILIIVAIGGILIAKNRTVDNGEGSNNENQEVASADVEADDPEEGSKQEKLKQAFDSTNKRFGGNETPIEVSASPAVQGDLIQRVSGQGRVHAYKNVDIINEVSGRLMELKVRDGQMVKKGRLIAQIDKRDYLLDYQRAESALLKAKADYLVENHGAELTADGEKQTLDPETIESELAEITEKYEQGLISESEYSHKKLMLDLKKISGGGYRDAVVSARTLDEPRTQLRKAEIALERTEVRAPFDGMIFEVSVAEGQLLGANTKICRLVNMNDLVVKVQVLESEMGYISLGRPATVTFPALKDMGAVTGKVEAVSPLVDAEKKTIETIIRIDNQSDRIRPGMFADVKVDSKIFENRLQVPKNAILPRDDRKVVFIVGEDNRAKWIYVQTGVENEHFVEITSGDVKPGDLVLTDNHFTMGHDTLVKVVND